MLGERRFHLVCEWWTARKKLLEGAWGQEAIEMWLGANAEGDQGNWKRTECETKFFEMVADLNGLLSETQSKVVRSSNHAFTFLVSVLIVKLWITESEDRSSTFATRATAFKRHDRGKTQASSCWSSSQAASRR